MALVLTCYPIETLAVTSDSLLPLRRLPPVWPVRLSATTKPCSPGSKSLQSSSFCPCSDTALNPSNKANPFIGSLQWTDSLVNFGWGFDARGLPSHNICIYPAPGALGHWVNFRKRHLEALWRLKFDSNLITFYIYTLLSFTFRSLPPKCGHLHLRLC